MKQLSLAEMPRACDLGVRSSLPIVMSFPPPWARGCRTLLLHEGRGCVAPELGSRLGTDGPGTRQNGLQPRKRDASDFYRV